MKVQYRSLDFIGYPYYRVSNTGIVYSIHSLRSITPVCGNNGYLSVTLYNVYGRKRFNIHRLVALAFIPNNNNSYCVNHKDGNKHNNCVDNLEWCTSSENNLHALQNGLRLKNRLISERDVHEICKLLEQGLTVPQIIQRLDLEGLTKSFIQHVKSKETWEWVSRQYNIPDVNKRVTDDIVYDICKCLENKMRDSDISKQCGVTPVVVQNIRLGRSHRKISSRFKI